MDGRLLGELRFVEIRAIADLTSRCDHEPDLGGTRRLNRLDARPLAASTADQPQDLAVPTVAEASVAHCGMNCRQVAEMASRSRAARSSLNRVRRQTLSMATSSALSSPLFSMCLALVTSAGPILRRRPPIRPFALAAARPAWVRSSMRLRSNCGTSAGNWPLYIRKVAIQSFKTRRRAVGAGTAWARQGH